MATVEKTISRVKGESTTQINDSYKGLSDDQIERYHREVKERCGEDALKESEERVTDMDKEKFAALQAEGGKIFQAISHNMTSGCDSTEIQ